MKFLAFLALSLFSVSAFAISINFDTDPDGNPVANQTNVNTLYTSLGVTFSMIGGTPCDANTTNAFANNDHPGDFGSLPNVLSTCVSSSSDISENSTGGSVRADFSTDVSSACISVRPDNGVSAATLRGYDIDGNLVDTQQSAIGVTEQLCVTGSSLRRVQFSGTSPNFARFDDFVFTPVATPTPTPTPLPIPQKARVKVKGHSARITMENFGDGAVYNVTAQRGRNSDHLKTKTTSTNITRLKNLRTGGWRVTYQVTLNDLTSDASPAKRFTIE